MDKPNNEQMEEIGATLVDLASIFSPKNAAALKGLVMAATQLNNMISSIRNQTDATSEAVWDEVRADYRESVAAFKASMERNG
jgi:hypothetical protein